MFDEILKNARADIQNEAHLDESGLMSNDKVRISVIGLGGGGCNTINRMVTMGLKSAKTIAVNTDRLHLDIINADKKVLIGKSITKGLGAGGFPEVGTRCAELSKSEILEAMGENELVFICAGMGGGTGTGSAPVVAKLAKDMGAVVVGIVTSPFSLERARLKKAEWGVKELSKYTDTLIIIDNNRLVSYAPNLPVNKAFMLADEITTKAVKGICDTIMFPSLMNIDYADVRSVMEEGGVSLISIGEASGPDKVEQVVKDTLNHPLLDVSYEGAKGALVHITGSSALSLGDSVKIGERLTEVFDPNAQIKVGARLDENAGARVEVIMIATGLKIQNIFGHQSAADQDVSETKEMLLEQLGMNYI
jgi:cell division protein FtsZ